MQNGRVHAGDLSATTPLAAPSGGRAALALIWQFWKAYGERIAFFQTTVILTIIYALVVGVMWLVGKLTGHRFLPLQSPTAPTFWYPSTIAQHATRADLSKQG